MKINLLLQVLIFLSFSCNENIQEKRRIITEFPVSTPHKKINNDPDLSTGADTASAIQYVKVYYTSSYCGGAVPPKEILDHHRSWRPLSNSSLRLKNISSGRDTVITTDHTGILTVFPGEYDCYLTTSVNKNLDTGFNPDCEEWTGSKVATMHVRGKKEKAQSILIHFDCDPCDATIKKRP